MSPERLLKHFNQVAEAPNAIPRLRRFILDLAVRGKLVEQAPKDESAVELLKRIEEEKARLLKKGVLKKQILIQPENNGLPFELPDLWTLSSLGEVAQYGLPDKVDSNKHISSDTWVLDLEDIEKDTSCLLKRVFSFDRAFQSSKTRFKKDDVLFGKLRPYLNKVIVADMDGVCSSEIVPVRGFCKMAPEYIRLILKSPLTMKRVDRLMYGMKMPRLGTNDALALSFPLPPLAEQHRIVAKVDELMALCNELEAAQAKRESRRARLVAATLHGISDPQSEFRNSQFFIRHFPRLTTRSEHIQQLRQTILNLAVRGKLVPQDPKEEPALELLKRIESEKSQLANGGKSLRKNRLSHKKADTLPWELPTNWLWTCLAELSIKIHYGYTASANPRTQDVRLLRITDIQNNTVYWESVPGCEIADKKVDQYLLSEGDILIARTGGTIGKSFLVKSIPVKAVFASYLIRVQCSHELFDRYMKLFFESPVYWKQLEDGSRGAGQPNVNGQTLGKMFVPLPPVDEQHRIVAKVDELMALCDEIEARITTTATTRRQLLEAKLHEALGGVY